jgi:NAD(P)-dependent dehydrogenase (short-subunit alcohol dehydrogenase family)
MSSLSFAGKVAIITGAGGALGKSYALDLAKRGCSLVVNDVGALVTGEANANATKQPSSAGIVA